MIVQLYSVFDRGAKSFGAPMVFANDEMCIRGCKDLYRGGGDAPMILYPGDFDVYHLGQFETDLGVVAGEEAPRLVVRFADVSAEVRGMFSRSADATDVGLEA